MILNPRVRRILPWIALAPVCIAVLLRAGLHRGEKDEFRALDASRRQLFAVMASHEREWRDKSAKTFPGDPWSQDDMFHSLEMQRAWSLAGLRGVGVPDVLRAVDDGMREGWGNPGQMKATVPPCHPRPEY